MDVSGAITSEAQAQGVDPSLALSIGQAESNLDPNIPNSPKGAVGVMQLMPSTAAGLGVDPSDPAQNIRGGVKYIKQLSDKYGGDPALVAAAYNAGPGAVDHHGGVPPYPETQAYVAKVTGQANSNDAASAAAAYLSNGTRQVTPDPGGAVHDPATGEQYQPDPNNPGKYLNAQGAQFETVNPQDVANQAAEAQAASDAYAKAHATPTASTSGATPQSVGDQVLQGISGGVANAANVVGLANPGVSAFRGLDFMSRSVQNIAALIQDAQGRNNAVPNPNSALAAFTGGPLNAPVANVAGAPKNLPERIGRTIGDYAPAALVPGAGADSALAGLVGRATNVALPAAGSLAGSEGVRAIGGNQQAQNIAGAVGGLVGGAGAAVAQGGVPAGEPVAGVDPANPVPIPVAAQAAKYVATKMGGVNQDMVEAAASGKPVTTAEMLGNPGKVALKAVATKSPEVNAQLSDALGNRSDAIQDNYANAFGQAAGVDPGAAKGDFDQQIAAARANLKPQYQAIMSSPDPVMTPSLAEIAQRPAVQKAMAMAANSLRNAGKDPTAIGLQPDASGAPVLGAAPAAPAVSVGGDQLSMTPAIQAQLRAQGVLPTGEPVSQSQPTLEAWDLTKKAMQDQVQRDQFGRVITQGEPGRFNRDTNTAATDLTAALRSASPAYGDVLDQAGDYMRQQSAFEAGQSHLLDPKTSVADGADYFGKLSPPEQDAYRAGMANTIFQKAQNNGLTQRLFAKPIVQGKLDYALPGGADNFLQDVRHYGAMNNNATFMQPGGGSVTTPLKEEINAQDAAGGGIKGMLGDMAGDFVVGTAIGHNPLSGAAYAGSKAVLKGATKLSDLISNAQMPQPIRDEVGRILMSNMTPAQLQDYLGRITAGASAPSPALSQSAISGVLGSNISSVNNQRPNALSGVP